MIMEEKHAIRVQNFHQEQTFHDLLPRSTDISVISVAAARLHGASRLPPGRRIRWQA
jgi:hypothetical protein